jgi:hypothetical protein
MEEYRKSQTTSTKCQYHAAHSNPVVWSFELSDDIRRFREIAKNEDPISTCSPWNPVAMKNVDPYTESLMENCASMYSKAWKVVNVAPRIMVAVSHVSLFFDLFNI